MELRLRAADEISTHVRENFFVLVSARMTDKRTRNDVKEHASGYRTVNFINSQPMDSRQLQWVN